MMQKINESIKKIKDLDTKAMQEAQIRLDSLTKPQGSLGRLEEIAKHIAGITGKVSPPFKNKIIFTLASDHGITEEGVSCFPKEVTAQMVYNFLNAGAGINILAKHIGARVVVVDMGVAEKIKIADTKSKNFIDKKINFGTKNFTKGPAMTKEEAIRSIEAGIEIFEQELKSGIDIVGTGDMGIGNTSSSSAITAVITQRAPVETTGRGTGIDDRAYLNKLQALKKAIEINRPMRKDALDVLSKVGGFEIGGLAGIILAAASHRIPVVVDGFISGAAALIAFTLAPKIKDYLLAAHCSVEMGHKIILEHLSLKPILNLGLRLGEGTGAALGIGIVEASIKILTQMATFKNAEVSQKLI